MKKHFFAILLCSLTLALPAGAQSAKSSASKSAGPGPDKAYLEKLLAGWSAMNSANMKQYYVQGDYLFFDISPLKYKNWDEYEKGTAGLFKAYKSFKLTLNDDAQVHREGDLAWAAATVNEDATTAAGKHEMATMRWTLVFQKMDGNWLIVHEHTSEPMQ